MPNPRIELEIGYHCPIANRDDNRFRAACEWLVSRFRIDQMTASIAIVDDAAIQLQNLLYLQHDWPTDVISLVYAADDGVVDGEVIASAETAARICDQAGWSVEDELLLYVVHGLLHLSGMDDASEDQRKAMRTAEQACLLALGVQRADLHMHGWDGLFHER